MRSTEWRFAIPSSRPVPPHTGMRRYAMFSAAAEPGNRAGTIACGCARVVVEKHPRSLIRTYQTSRQEAGVTSRDIPTLLAILACVLAATVLTWWLSMRAIDCFLQRG